MILGLLIVGILLTTAGIRGTAGQLATQFGRDMTGTDGFIVWFGALLLIGLIGFIPGLQRPSRYLIALVLLVIVLRNQGIFANLVTAFAQADTAGPAAPAATVNPTAASVPPASNSNNPVSQATGILGALGSIGGLFGL